MESKRNFPFLIKIIQGSVYLRCLVTTFILFSLVFIQKPLFAQSFDENYDYSSDWVYNPFNSNSAWHRPIGTDAIYADDSDITNVIWQQAKRLLINDNFPFNSVYGIAQHNHGPFAYGALLAIPPGPDCIVNGKVHDIGGPDLTKMGLREPDLRIAQAMRDYGVYLVDNAGSFNIRAAVSNEEQLSASVRAAVMNDLAKITRELRLVKNSVEGATARMSATWGPGGWAVGSIGTPTWPAGGGEPLAPNTAIDFCQFNPN